MTCSTVTLNAIDTYILYSHCTRLQLFIPSTPLSCICEYSRVFFSQTYDLISRLGRMCMHVQTTPLHNEYYMYTTPSCIVVLFIWKTYLCVTCVLHMLCVNIFSMVLCFRANIWHYWSDSLSIRLYWRIGINTALLPCIDTLTSVPILSLRCVCK